MQGTEDPESSNPLVAALLAGNAPRPLKISAARGVLPLVRAELLKILVVLLKDSDTEVRDEAGARLVSLSEDEIRTLLEDPATPPAVLDHFGADPRCTPALREALVSNPATSAATLCGIVSALTTAQIDLILLNQTRLIAHPELIDLIETGGPPLTPLQRARIEELRHHFLRTPAASAPAPAPQAVAEAEPPAAAPPPPPSLRAPTTAPAAPESLPETVLIANATQKILRMNTAEKVQLAIKGTREERTILIKDSSKLVQEAVLDSPKLNENEVEGIAKLRSVSEDVLRIIAGNRDWIKSYTITHSLALNPKTPIGIAISLVSRLTSRDLKILGSDKNVSETVRRHARKVILSRNQRSGTH